MKLKRLIVGSLVAGAALTAFRQLFAASAPDKKVTQKATCDAIDAYVEEQMQRLRVPGVSLAIVEADRIVHLRGFGRARPNGGVPSPQTPFFIASLTKSFTALAVMQLVEAGRIELDAPVQCYLPWFRVADPLASAQITVRHLLYQTSGLPTSAGETQLADSDMGPGATERQARALSTVKLNRLVGSAFEYSNANYNLLGLIIEQASGEPYADYIGAKILAPLHMSNTYGWQARTGRTGLAVGHRYWFAFPFAAPNMPIPLGALPGGGLISSTEDMAHYLIAHLNGGRFRDIQILSGASIDELHRGVAEIAFMGRSLGRYGMGWFVDQIAGTKLVWHGGTLPHFFAYMALLPEQSKGVVLFFNACHHWMNPVLTEVGTGVSALLAGSLPEPSPVPFTRMIPWGLRSLLFIPAIQTIDVAATVRLLRRWRLAPELRPRGGRERGLHVLAPLLANLFFALNLIPMMGRRRGYLMLYKPDSSWITLACGSFALLWSFLRTRWVLRALSEDPSSPPSGSEGEQGGAS